MIDVALWFMDHGSAYDPAGSLPWVWADKPIRSLVAGEVGHRSVDLQTAVAGAAVPSPEPAVVELRSLAESEPRVALLIEAVEIVGSERDAKVHLEYRVQWALGDPSPSHTVASMVGLEAANVRQIDTRARQTSRVAICSSSSQSVSSVVVYTNPTLWPLCLLLEPRHSSRTKQIYVERDLVYTYGQSDDLLARGAR